MCKVSISPYDHDSVAQRAMHRNLSAFGLSLAFGHRSVKHFICEVIGRGEEKHERGICHNAYGKNSGESERDERGSEEGRPKVYRNKG